jgi:hypothetical protein
VKQFVAFVTEGVTSGRAVVLIQGGARVKLALRALSALESWHNLAGLKIISKRLSYLYVLPESLPAENIHRETFRY